MSRKINNWAMPFAAWELRLYLDTHPHDMKALAAYKQLCSAMQHFGGNVGNYAFNTEQGRDNHDEQSNRPHQGCDCIDESFPVGWTWINDPWPWQFEANVDAFKADCED